MLLNIHACYSLKRPLKVLYREAKHSTAADLQSAKVSTNTATYNILRICLSYLNFHLQMPTYTQHVLAEVLQTGGLINHLMHGVSQFSSFSTPSPLHQVVLAFEIPC